MSKLILNKLDKLKPLVKAKGLDCEKYGIIENGILYFNNGVIEVDIPVDIPFDVCINLHQLITVLSSLKGETVLVNNDGKVNVIFDDRQYNIETMPMEVMIDNFYFFNLQPQVECESPTVFKEMCKISETYVQAPENFNNLAFTHETMLIVNNEVFCSDKFNIIQGILDFGMPSCAFTIDVLLQVNKLLKSANIIGMAITTTHLALKLDNELTVYLPNAVNEKAMLAYTKLTTVINNVWEKPNIIIPEIVKHQFAILKKVSLQNAVFFNNSFCQADNSKIEYSSFTDIPFSFKCLYKNLLIAFNTGYVYSFGEKGMSFVSEDQRIRGFIGRVLQDER